jgi:outer membrane protein assembly factor BamD (BamD/ComL family)
MLANLYMYQEDFTSALEYLYDIPDDTRQGAYANYNMGVAMIRSGQRQQGIQLLRTVMNLAPGGTETNALKDRAALAIGLTALRNDDYATARSALKNVRADGPFSNEALLALGMANFDRGQPKKALPLWLELVQRDAGHKAVQEALMLAPRAYEDVGAMPQALAGYQFAADSYRRELKNVERAIRQINNIAWLEKLKPATPPEQEVPDPMQGLDDYTAESGPQMAYLYKLFASHDFARMFRQYVQLDRLRQLLAVWERELPAMGETLARQKSSLSASLDPVRSQLVDARKKQRELEMQANELLGSIPPEPDMNHPEDVASRKELIMWNRVQEIERELKGQSGPRAEQLRRVRGLLLWDIAKDANQQRQQQQRAAQDLVTETSIAGTRTRAVEQLVRDATRRLRGDLDRRFSQQYKRLSSIKGEVTTLIGDVKQVLKNDALRVLAERRKQLADRLGQARLAIARVQDESVSGQKQSDSAAPTDKEAEQP